VYYWISPYKVRISFAYTLPFSDPTRNIVVLVLLNMRTHPIISFSREVFISLLLWTNVPKVCHCSFYQLLSKALCIAAKQLEQHFLLSGDTEGVIILWENSLVDAKVVICLFQHSLVTLHWFPQPPIGKNDTLKNVSFSWIERKKDSLRW